ncbi:hypothetical protein AB1E18_000753 [Capra hircus]
MEAGVLRGGGDGASVSEGPESRLAAFRFFRGALLLKQHSCPSAGDRDSHAPREPCSPARCSQGSRTFPAHRGAFCAGPGAIPRKSHPHPLPEKATSRPKAPIGDKGAKGLSAAFRRLEAKLQPHRQFPHPSRCVPGARGPGPKAGRVHRLRQTPWRPWTLTPQEAEPTRTGSELEPGGDQETFGSKGAFGFQHPVRLYLPISKRQEYLQSSGEKVLASFPVQATIHFYNDESESEEELEEDTQLSALQLEEVVDGSEGKARDGLANPARQPGGLDGRDPPSDPDSPEAAPCLSSAKMIPLNMRKSALYRNITGRRWKKMVEEEDGEITSLPTNTSETHQDTATAPTAEDPRPPEGQAELLGMRDQTNIVKQSSINSK